MYPVAILYPSVTDICSDGHILCISYPMSSDYCFSNNNIDVYNNGIIINTITDIITPYDMLLHNDILYLLYNGRVDTISPYGKESGVLSSFSFDDTQIMYTSDTVLDVYRHEVVIRTCHWKNFGKDPDPLMRKYSITLIPCIMKDYENFRYYSLYEGLVKQSISGKEVLISKTLCSGLCVYNKFLYSTMTDGYVEKRNKDGLLKRWQINDRIGYNPNFFGVIEDYLYLSYDDITYRWDKDDYMTIFLPHIFRKLVKWGDSFYGIIPRNCGTNSSFSDRLFWFSLIPCVVPFINKGVILSLIKEFKRRNLPKDVIRIILNKIKHI